MYTNMLAFISNTTLRSIALGVWWKTAAFPGPLVWPRVTIHRLIHPLIPLLFHSDVPRTCSCPWETDVLLGIMAECHIFLSIYILFCCLYSALPIFSVWKSVYGIHVCVCSVYVSACWIPITLFVWERCYHSTNPLLQWYLPPPPPISVLVCLLLQHLVHNLPTSSYFTLWEEHRTRVRRLPSSHLWALTLPEKHTRAQTHSQHMHSVSLHCLICIWAQVVH